MAEKLTSERWKRIDEVLDEVLDAPAERGAERLRQIHAEDPDLAREIRSLLEAETRSEILDSPAHQYLATLIDELPGVDAERGVVPPAAVRAAARFQPGTTLAGRYRIATALGQGGMGEVFRADDLRLGQTVALKFLPAELATSRELNRRLLKEIKLARQISHPNVCRVYDLGETEDQLFLSMEFIEGEDLAALLKRIGRLPNEKAVEIAQQLCAGLAAAHEQGILHRDLKPANVMLDKRGRVRITDFGLAGFGDEIGRGEAMAGTPAYMAPEQLAGDGVSIQSDLYALGLMLYELFTGRRPYQGESRAELLELQRETTPPTPSSWVQGLDPVIEKAILRCLEARPSDRPVSARAVAAALPGSDPLAAALEAGETPSPDLIAAAGPQGSIRPRTAGICLASLVVGLALCAHVEPLANLVGLVPWSKPAPALISDAREMIAELGHSEPPADSASQFIFDPDYYRYLRATDLSPDRWRPVERPGQLALRFVYRQSREPLLPLSWSGRVVNDLPGVATPSQPAAEAGDLLVITDLRGRLRYMRAVSGDSVVLAAGSDDLEAARLSEAAGLDLGAFQRVQPLGALPVYAEERMAWSGVWPEAEDLPVRVEAGFAGGRPVFFECVFPFRPNWQPGTAPRAATRVNDHFLKRLGWRFFIFTLVLVPVVLAIRNLKSGRGDRRGAARLAIAVLIVRFAWWVVGGHHVADFWGEFFVLFGNVAARSLFAAAAAWLAYIAIEPFARRMWPHALVSWTRALKGRFADPMVARDILAGLLAAVLGHPIALAYFWLPQWLGWSDPPQPVLYPLWIFFAPMTDPLLGARDAVAAVGSALMGAAWNSMSVLAILIALLALVKRRWLAIVLVIVLLAFNHWSAHFSNFQWLGIAVAVLSMSVYGFLFLRFGVLATAAASFVAFLFAASPLTTDPTVPYFGTSLFTLTVVGALGAYCAWRAVGSAVAPVSVGSPRVGGRG